MTTESVDAIVLGRLKDRQSEIDRLRKARERQPQDAPLCYSLYLSMVRVSQSGDDKGRRPTVTNGEREILQHVGNTVLGIDDTEGLRISATYRTIAQQVARKAQAPFDQLKFNKEKYAAFLTALALGKPDETLTTLLEIPHIAYNIHFSSQWETLDPKTYETNPMAQKFQGEPIITSRTALSDHMLKLVLTQAVNDNANRTRLLRIASVFGEALAGYSKQNHISPLLGQCKIESKIEEDILEAEKIEGQNRDRNISAILCSSLPSLISVISSIQQFKGLLSHMYLTEIGVEEKHLLHHAAKYVYGLKRPELVDHLLKAYKR